MIPFVKMTGSGNDFILIDNFDNTIDMDKIVSGISKLCARGLSEGADGVIIISPDNEVDFKWDFYNSDGSTPSMCGNGSRCVARFAYLQKRAPKKMKFRTVAGIIEAEVKNGTTVRSQLTKPYGTYFDKKLEGFDFQYSFINTGVPHIVIFVPMDAIEQMDVLGLGRIIRNHPDFAPDGTNVNFTAVLPDGSLRVRTYERGVEGETLACGTGCTASALIAASKKLITLPVSIKTTGNIDLIVATDRMDPAGIDYGNVYLEGEARQISSGNLSDEAFNY